MRRMLPATLTEFLQLQPVRSSLPILGGRIVPLFAITALHRNNFSGHENSSWLLAFTTENRELTNRQLVFLPGSRPCKTRVVAGPRPATGSKTRFHTFTLLHNLADGSRAHRVPAFADRETQALL